MSNPPVLMYSGTPNQQQPAYTPYHHYNPNINLSYNPQIPNGYGQEQQHHVPVPQPGSAPQYQSANEQLSLPLQISMPTTSVTTSAMSAPATSDISAVVRTQPSPEANQTSNSELPVKRKRGRPKGSKTKNKQVNGAATTSTNPSTAPTAAAKLPTPTPNPVAPSPAKPPTVTHQNPVQYHSGNAPVQQVPNFMTANSYPGDNLSITTPEEFQWKALSLCSAFYGAAEDLIKATPPGFLEPSWSGDGLNDPMKLLNEARQFCDSLLNVTNRTAAHTSTPVVTQPEPGPLAQHYLLQQQHQSQSAPSPAIATQSLASPSLYHSQQATSNSFASPSTTSILPQPPHQPRTQFPSATYNISPTLSFAAAQKQTQIHWTPEEENRLKDLAERSKEQNPQSGEIDWDYVARWFGEGRSKRQILIKANSIGLKSAQSPPKKRRREEDKASGPSTSNYSPQQSSGQAMFTLPQ